MDIGIPHARHRLLHSHDPHRAWLIWRARQKASPGGVMSAARKSHSPQSTLLAARLKARIARNGPISVADYMETCLADASAGYYPSRQPIGAAGDFITAPEVSQIFGELLGLWAVAVVAVHGRAARCHRGRARSGPRHAHGRRAARLEERARLPRQCVGRPGRDEPRVARDPARGAARRGGADPLVRRSRRGAARAAHRHRQ